MDRGNHQPGRYADIDQNRLGTIEGSPQSSRAPHRKHRYDKDAPHGQHHGLAQQSAGRRVPLAPNHKLVSRHAVIQCDSRGALSSLRFRHCPSGVGREDRQRASLGISQQSCCCFQEHANTRENDFNEADDRMSLHCRISHDAVFRGYSGECAGSAQRLLSAKLPECGGL